MMPGARAALVTGAASAIGRTLALTLAADGWSVALHHHPDAAAAIAPAMAEIAAGGGRAVGIAADLADAGAVEVLLQRAATMVGPSTCLVDGAFDATRDTVASTTPAGWDVQAAINQRAPLLLMRAFAAQLPEGAEGVVVNLLGGPVHKPSAAFFSDAISKAARAEMTRAAALSLAPRVRVNGIAIADMGWATNDRTLDEGLQGDLSAALRLILSLPAMTGQIIALAPSLPPRALSK